MKLVKLILICSLTGVLFIGCKDTASKPLDDNTIAKKETVAQKPETASFHIEGMTCAFGCAKTIEKKLAKTEGIQNAKVDFDNKEATVTFDASLLTLEKITEIVETIGDGETYEVSEMKINQ